MIVLDTNVVSELLRDLPDQVVLGWWQRQPTHTRFTTVITVAELQYGIARLPQGRRRAELDSAVGGSIAAFADQVLAFDHAAARIYGEILAARERAGRPMGILDAQIAAICRAHDASLATRNRRDFEGTGLELIDPWNTEG